MGDMSEYKGLITAGTLLACFAILSMAIPVQLYTADDQRILTPPDYFDIGDLYSYSEIDIINMTGTLTSTGYPPGTWRQVQIGGGDFGGWDVDFLYRYGEDPDLKLGVAHMHTEWFGVVGADHGLEMYNDNGLSRDTTLEVAELEADMVDGTANYRGECDHLSLYIVVAYNKTLYGSAEEAWDNEGLGVFFGIHFDDMNTGFNAMNLIASILFFQMPEVHIAINLLIAIPIWIAIGYISLILILRAIEALPFT